jgi:hypothetical protein
VPAAKMVKPMTTWGMPTESPKMVASSTWCNEAEKAPHPNRETPSARARLRNTTQCEKRTNEAAEAALLQDPPPSSV